MDSAAAYHLGILARAEIRLSEDLLEAQDLHPHGGGLLDERDVGLDHALPDRLGRVFRVALERDLDQSGPDACHGCAACLVGTCPVPGNRESHGAAVSNRRCRHRIDFSGPDLLPAPRLLRQTVASHGCSARGRPGGR